MLSISIPKPEGIVVLTVAGALAWYPCTKAYEYNLNLYLDPTINYE
jgi:hypothetical protein